MLLGSIAPGSLLPDFLQMAKNETLVALKLRFLFCFLPQRALIDNLYPFVYFLQVLSRLSGSGHMNTVLNVATIFIVGLFRNLVNLCAGNVEGYE